MQKHTGFVRLINAGFPDRVDEYSYKGVQSKFSTEPVSLPDSLAFWERIVNAIEEEAKRIPSSRYLRITYEDLVFRPKREITKMITFLGIQKDVPGMIRAPNVPGLSRVAKQHRALSTNEYASLTRQSESTLRRLGYPVSTFSQRQQVRILSIRARILQVRISRLVRGVLRRRLGGLLRERA
jgi:hypothetical protein